VTIRKDETDTEKVITNEEITKNHAGFPDDKGKAACCN
jgi:hypothetical protein